MCLSIHLSVLAISYFTIFTLLIVFIGFSTVSHLQCLLLPFHFNCDSDRDASFAASKYKLLEFKRHNEDSASNVAVDQSTTNAAVDQSTKIDEVDQSTTTSAVESSDTITSAKESSDEEILSSSSKIINGADGAVPLWKSITNLITNVVRRASGGLLPIALLTSPLVSTSTSTLPPAALADVKMELVESASDATGSSTDLASRSNTALSSSMTSGRGRGTGRGTGRGRGRGEGRGGKLELERERIRGKGVSTRSTSARSAAATSTVTVGADPVAAAAAVDDSVAVTTVATAEIRITKRNEQKLFSSSGVRYTSLV